MVDLGLQNRNDSLFGGIFEGGGLGGLFGGGDSGGSGGGGLGGALSGALSGAAVGGPWGAAIGAAGSFLSGILGDITMQGWSISCIGRQAFDKNDFNTHMTDLETKKNAVNGSNFGSVSAFLDHCSNSIEVSNLEIGRYVSSCSKALRQKYVDALMALIAEIVPYYQITYGTKSATDWKGAAYSYKTYTVTGMKAGAALPPPSGGGVPSGGGSVSVPVPDPNFGNGFDAGNYYDVSQGLGNAYDSLPVPDQVLLSGYASQNGMALNDVLTAFFSGQLQIKDGRIIWGVSAGNQKSGGIGDLLLYGVVGLLAYKFIIKK